MSNKESLEIKEEKKKGDKDTGVQLNNFFGVDLDETDSVNKLIKTNVSHLYVIFIF
jgi:hypothetical protein